MEVLDHEIRRGTAIAAHHRIHARRQSILERTGFQPSSSELIRELRSSEGRHGKDFLSWFPAFGFLRSLTRKPAIYHY